MNSNITYEVETRLYFSSDEEAFAFLPFLKDSLGSEFEWVTHTYGLVLFKSGSLLRSSEIYKDGHMKAYLGYKEPDQGTFCNIRVELDENITEEVHGSSVLKALKVEDATLSPKNVEQVLASRGYEKFMTFEGRNRTGYNKEHDIALKLMHCDTLEFPILVELEKSAGNMEECLKAEEELKELIHSLGLTDRVVRREPPTLLFEATF